MNDTRAPHILAYDYDAESGRASNKRIFAETEYKGRPDGLCIEYVFGSPRTLLTVD